MKLTWPEPMPEQRRLSTGESDAAWASGVCLTVAPNLSCQQVLNIMLFFDGTNNNDAEDNPWRDSKTDTHTNVARLYNAALDKQNRGIFS